MLDIELDMVVPMYLHILLGVVVRLHDWLVEEADAMDKKLAILHSESATVDNIPNKKHPMRILAPLLFLTLK